LAVHPALYSWREELPGTLVRVLAYLGGIAVLSMVAAQMFRAPTATDAIPATRHVAWVDIAKPFPAFALSIPEAADVATNYVVRRDVTGGGRKDILSLGEPDGVAPFLRVEIYRPGGEIAGFADPQSDLVAAAVEAGPITALRTEAPLASKFGPLSVITFDLSAPTPRHCLGFVRDFDVPRLQLSGRFCRGGTYVERSTLACALDRLTLLSEGSEPQVGKLFAQAELHRSFCGQHDPIFASTPKYKLLWKALANRPEPRRIGP
jgi:hypothetical protein